MPYKRAIAVTCAPARVNKKITEEVATIPSKRLRNKIAGFTTHLMKRIQKGPVRGISLKLQEEERERRMEFVPDRSEAGKGPWNRLISTAVSLGPKA